MLPHHADPIVAIATAPGRGAVGIVRVSGKGLAPFVRALIGRDLKPREATYGPWRGADGQPIDHGLSLWFPAPHSYTGEDVLELQGHGEPVVLQLLLARCLEVAQGVLPGLRLARAGITRVCAIGAMTAPEAGWHHDGGSNLRDLVRIAEIESSAERAADRLAPYAQEDLL